MYVSTNPSMWKHGYLNWVECLSATAHPSAQRTETLLPASLRVNQRTFAISTGKGHVGSVLGQVRQKALKDPNG